MWSQLSHSAKGFLTKEGGNLAGWSKGCISRFALFTKSIGSTSCSFSTSSVEPVPVSSPTCAIIGSVPVFGDSIAMHLLGCLFAATKLSPFGVRITLFFPNCFWNKVANLWHSSLGYLLSSAVAKTPSTLVNPQGLWECELSHINSKEDRSMPALSSVVFFGLSPPCMQFWNWQRE